MSDFLAPSDGSRAPELSLEPALMPQRYVDQDWEEPGKAEEATFAERRGGNESEKAFHFQS